MAKQVDYNTISFMECSDRSKHDLTTSLYIYELERATNKGLIRWEREWSSKSNCYNYFGIYTNKHGVKVKLELLDSIQDGIELTASYSNHGRLIKTLFVTEWTYDEELQDLEKAVYDQYKDKMINPYHDKKYNTYKKKKESTALVPWYKDKIDNSKVNYSEPTITKVRNSRGLKADRLLENVEFAYNFQILGEKGCYTK